MGILDQIRDVAMLLEVPESSISGIRDMLDPTVVFLEFATQRGGFLSFIVSYHEYTAVGAHRTLEVNYVSGLSMFTSTFLKDIGEYNHTLYLQVPPEVNGGRYLQFHIVEKVFRYYSRERRCYEFYIETLEGQTIHSLKEPGPIMNPEQIYSSV